MRTHAATVAGPDRGDAARPLRRPGLPRAGHIRLTNKTPAGTYRAPGRYESTFVRERLIDAIAHRLGLDPIEVRRINLIPPRADAVRPRRSTRSAPRSSTTSGDYPGLLDSACSTICATTSSKRRWPSAGGQGELVGLGFGMFVEKSGLGPFDGVRDRRRRATAGSRW